MPTLWFGRFGMPEKHEKWHNSDDKMTISEMSTPALEGYGLAHQPTLRTPLHES
jgi:hypothetical protein